MRHSPYRPRAPRATAHARPGISLAEVLVALVLLAIGALGVVSTSAFASRLTATGQLMLGAAREVGHLVDSLRTAGCPALVAGSSASPHGSATWTANTNGNAATIAVTMVPATPRLTTPLVSETIIPCE